MAIHYKCGRCGRTFWSSGSSACWNCGSNARNQNTETLEWLGVLLLVVVVVLYLVVMVWKFVVLPVFNLIIIVISIVPVAFGIVSTYLVAAVLGEGIPGVSPSAYPTLVFILCCLAVRVVIFLHGHGRKGLLFVALYLLLAVSVGLVLSYTNMRPLGFDATSAATGAPAMIEGRMWALEYVTLGKLPALLAAYGEFTEFAANLDTDLLTVGFVVYWFMLPMDLVLLIKAWADWHYSGREAPGGEQVSSEQPEVVEQ